MGENKPGNCFPWERLDDLILFGMMFLVMMFVAWLNHWDLVNSLASYIFGAATTYLKGKS